MNYRDIEILSTLLLTPEDLDAIASTPGVAETEAVWLTDGKVSAGDTRQDVQVISLPERVNLPELLEGRLPESGAECAVEKGLADDMGWRVGDTVEAVNARGEAAPYLKDGRFVITGIANHPDHTSVSIPDTLYVLVTPEAFDMEALENCCMKAEVVIEKPADMDRFSTEYDDAVALVMARLDVLAGQREWLRAQDVRAEARSELDDGRGALEEGRTGLEEARSELDEGWTALAAGVLLAVAATWGACTKLLRSTAIQLMQDKVPEGKKKASRRKGHLLSLYSRLILLNIRSDIRRGLVTIVSVAGCCALMVNGFTLKSAVEGALENQYTKIVDYDGRIRFDAETEENAGAHHHAGQRLYRAGGHLLCDPRDGGHHGGGHPGRGRHGGGNRLPDHPGHGIGLHPV